MSDLQGFDLLNHAAGPLAAPANAEDEGWKGDLGLSFTQQSGTTETVAGTLDVKLGRNWENDELALRALANYGASERRDDGREITQNSKLYVNTSFQPRETYVVLTFTYIVMVIALSLLLARFERFMSKDRVGAR